MATTADTVASLMMRRGEPRPTYAYYLNGWARSTIVRQTNGTTAYSRAFVINNLRRLRFDVRRTLLYVRHTPLFSEKPSTFMFSLVGIPHEAYVRGQPSENLVIRARTRAHDYRKAHPTQVRSLPNARVCAFPIVLSACV